MNLEILFIMYLFILHYIFGTYNSMFFSQLLLILLTRHVKTGWFISKVRCLDNY